MLWEIGAKIGIAEIAENELVAPELKGVVFMLVLPELIQLRLGVAAVETRRDIAFYHRGRADWAVCSGHDA